MRDLFKILIFKSLLSFIIKYNIRIGKDIISSDVGVTNMNIRSSRSHAILQINLEIKDNAIENEITFGKFILVKLTQ